MDLKAIEQIRQHMHGCPTICGDCLGFCISRVRQSTLEFETFLQEEQGAGRCVAVRQNGTCVLWTTQNWELWGQVLNDQGEPVESAWYAAAPPSCSVNRSEASDCHMPDSER